MVAPVLSLSIVEAILDCWRIGVLVDSWWEICVSLVRGFVRVREDMVDSMLVGELCLFYIDRMWSC